MSSAAPVETQIEAVVFDMGGVLVELGPLTSILGDDAMPEDEFWPIWLASETVRAFEMGRCTAEAFAMGLVADLGLAYDGAELLRRFAAWPQGLFDGAEDLVTELPGVVTAVLSNTNQLHWESQRDAEVVQTLFDRRYLSYELGLAKPDDGIFEHVIADLGCASEAVVFLDDNQLNVDAARRLGIEAHLTKGVEEARGVLAAVGLL
ncbi:MAG: HAD superfamily hydrolase (TIGR01509 family) [Acidimicrobiales bacterium]|jgi:glucose-1-phosphatase